MPDMPPRFYHHDNISFRSAVIGMWESRGRNLRKSEVRRSCVVRCAAARLPTPPQMPCFLTLVLLPFTSSSS
ncbi:hypothetical protein E2C01_043114 [Portunus trituberculatus]|uniref:Uncharacterized protein n=1 Tax=Portunus trituberculatus TaxID=210409 RepID=A0A5B7FUT4_PORTR|nr:hypothetical protein [Portunus trituberculatus]